jgi:hypothetical protein
LRCVASGHLQRIEHPRDVAHLPRPHGAFGFVFGGRPAARVEAGQQHQDTGKSEAHGGAPVADGEWQRQGIFLSFDRRS